MGGTGVALGVDGAAPFLNPATITYVTRDRIAFSSRFYRFSRTTLENFHQPGPVNEAQLADVRFSDSGVVDHRLHSVPDSICYFFPSIPSIAWRQRLSLCLAKTEEEELSVPALGFRDSSGPIQIDQNQHFDLDWSRFNIGPTWGVIVSDELSLGASLLVSFTRYQHTVSGHAVIENADTASARASSFESLMSVYSWDLVSRLGATYQLNRRLTAGLSVTVPLLHLFGGVRGTHMSESDTVRDQWSGDGSFSAVPPVVVGAGFGAQWESVRFEVDLFVAPGKSDYAQGELERNEVAYRGGQVESRSSSTLKIQEPSNTVVNLAVGAEIFLARRLSVLAGIQTDFNALDELEPNASDRLFRTRINYYRAGAGVSSYTDFGDLLVGLRFDYGAGEALPVNALDSPASLGRSDIQELGVMLVLAGSVNWGSIQQAAGELQDVMRGKGGPPPVEPPKPLQRPAKKK